MKNPFRRFSIILILILPAAFCHAQSNDLRIIKDRIVAELMKSEVEDAQVGNIVEKMREDGSFEGINYDDLSRTAGFPHRYHTSYLVYMARAYKTKASKYFQSKSLKNLIEKGLAYWVKNDYVGDNWHNNQISTPTNLVNLMLLVGDELPQDLVKKAQPMIGRAHMNASGARPSGDRIVIAGILAKNLLFLNDYERFDEVIKIIEGELKFATGKRGMQHDYSFHHRTDRVNNTDSYGYGKYANAYGEWSSYVAGTRYAFSQEKIKQLVDYYLDGIYKQSVYGVYPDVSVQNRSITHERSSFEPRGTLEIERVLASTDYRRDELEAIRRLRRGEAKPSSSFAKFFWQTEHFVVQRPHYYTTVRMFSTRNRNMEVPYNGPGKTTHHRADGTNHLLLDGDEYHNIWPVYDWQKIPGTTVLQKPELPGPNDIQKEGLTDFVGAVTDGLYGAAVFDFRSPHDPLTAKKSWFFFDKEYVCLGTGIASEARLPVATTINQVLLRSEVRVGQNGTAQKLPNGRRMLENVKWVHHDNVGYIFPESATVNLSNQTETGTWASITDEKNISDAKVSEDVFTLWFDHGQRPENASYQYIVVPGVTQRELDQTSRNNRAIEVLSNTPELQAVRHDGLGIAQAAFYRAGSLEVQRGIDLRLDSQGMVMLKTEDGRIKELTLADPSRKLGRMLLSVSGTYDVQTENCRTVQDKKQDRTLFIVDLPQGVYLGKSVQLAVE